MSLMLTKIYRVFLAACVPSAQAEEAAQEISGYENRLVRLETKVTLVLVGIGLLVTGMISLIVKVYGITGIKIA